MLLAAGRLITPTEELTPGWLRVEGATVGDLGQGPPPGPPDVSFPDGVVVPGFVDVHAHGGGGRSFMEGTTEAARAVVAAHVAHGTTTMMASLVTDTVPRLSEIVGTLADLVGSEGPAGLHLEGPWLSAAHHGAHDPALLRDPDPDEVEALLDAARGTVRMVTLAPERRHGLEAIRRLTDAGVVAAIGHTDARYEQTVAALAAGAGAGTHLFNAMRALHHREPGPVLALLDDDRAHLEVIADGVHLHPAIVRQVMTLRPERAVLVTDAMAAAAAGDGDYDLGPIRVRVSDGVARVADTGSIAGSTLTMAAAVRYAVTAAGVPLALAVRAATLSPATMLGLGGVGALRPGHRADLVVLDRSVEVLRTMRSGVWVER